MEKSIKFDILAIIKESIKFALMALIVFLIMGISLLYLFIYILKIDTDIGMASTGILSAIVIVMIDIKKFHTTEKMIYHNKRICEKLIIKIEKLIIKIKAGYMRLQ